MTSITSFIAELITRFFSPKPWFFKVIQIIAAVFAAASLTLSKLVDGGVLSADNKLVGILSSVITLTIAVTTAIVAQLPKKDANAVAK